MVLLPHLSDVAPLAADLSRASSKTPQRVTLFPAWESEAAERRVADDAFGARLRTLKALAGPADATRRGSLSLASKRCCSRRPPDRSIVEATQVDHGSANRSTSTSSATGSSSTAATGRPPSSCRARSRSGEASSTSYAPEAERPVRIELFGDEVESIRSFDAATQRSVAALSGNDVRHDARPDPTRAGALHRPPGGPRGRARLVRTWWSRPTCEEEGKFFHERAADPKSLHSVRTTLAEVFKRPLGHARRRAGRGRSKRRATWRSSRSSG